MKNRFNNPDRHPGIRNIPISDEEGERRDSAAPDRETPPAQEAAGRDIPAMENEPDIVPGGPGPEEPDPFYEAARAAEDRYIRLMADFENHRRRAVKEREAAEVSAVANAIRPLLDVLDNLERALDHAEPGPLQDGVALTVRQFQDALKRSGVLPIDPDVGERFDPSLHEAISILPNPAVPPEGIFQVISRGYRLGDRVIRPARVIVSSGGEGRAAS